MHEDSRVPEGELENVALAQHQFDKHGRATVGVEQIGYLLPPVHQVPAKVGGEGKVLLGRRVADAIQGAKDPG